MSQQQIINAKEIQVKNKHRQDIERLKHYKKKLIETSEFIKRELPNIDYLIRILEKMQNDNLTEKPYDQFLRENFGFNCDRFNRLLKDSTMLTPDEIEKVIIYLER